MTDTGGRYIAARHWRSWAVIDQSWNPPRDVGPTYPTEADAQAAADRLNTPRTPTPRTQQIELFDSQEAG